MRAAFTFSGILFCASCLLLASCAQAEDSQAPTPADETALAVLETATSEPPALPSVTASTTPAEGLTAVPTPTDRATPTATSAPSVTATATVTATPTPAFPIYTGEPLQRDLMGVQVHIHREALPEIMRHLSELGMGWVKVQVSWKLYESQPDQYTDRFLELDRLVNLATSNGINVLLSVSKAPEWSRPTTELDGPPSDYAQYTEFMTYLASRYAGQVDAYELWNEPNLQREWNGAPLSAADLVRLIAAGAAGVRAADANAILISAALATTGINDGVIAIDDRVFLREMLEAGVASHVDGIGVHPYGWANPPDSRAAAPDPGVPSHNNHPSFFFADTLADYTALLTAYGVDKPLWVTEFGWGSFEGLEDDEGDPASPPAGAEFMNDVTEWEQAQYIARALEIAQQMPQIAQQSPQIGPMILWNLNFGPTLGSQFSESGYSLLRPDGSPRPSYLTLQSADKR